MQTRDDWPTRSKRRKQKNEREHKREKQTKEEKHSSHWSLNYGPAFDGYLWNDQSEPSTTTQVRPGTIAIAIVLQEWEDEDVCRQASVLSNIPSYFSPTFCCVISAKRWRKADVRENRNLLYTAAHCTARQLSQRIFPQEYVENCWANGHSQCRKLKREEKGKNASGLISMHSTGTSCKVRHSSVPPQASPPFGSINYSFSVEQ